MNKDTKETIFVISCLIVFIVETSYFLTLNLSSWEYLLWAAGHMAILIGTTFSSKTKRIKEDKDV